MMPISISLNENLQPRSYKNRKLLLREKMNILWEKEILIIIKTCNMMLVKLIRCDIHDRVCLMDNISFSCEMCSVNGKIYGEN